MEFRILGPLEVRGESGVIALRGRKPRAVLAVLLLHPNEPVSPERLALALWGEDAPAAATSTVQVHVSRLRKALGNGEIVATTPAGYRLSVQPGELDVERFERLMEDGRRALSAGHAEEAASVLRDALSLWRGPPLADLAFEPFAQVEIARLEEQHLAAVEARIEADLAAGRHAQLIAELGHLVAEHPTSERLAGHLMLALYRCGRQAEALDAYRDARHRLASEIGVEPGPELHALQEAILHHDPSLDFRISTEDLPHELDTTAAAPLIGRDAELAWLRDRWDDVRTGAGALVALTGPRGMGKTRLAAELAAEVHRFGATVRYASGAGAPQALLDALGGAAEVASPVLFVMDDADQLRDEARTRLRDLANRSALVLAIAELREAVAALEPNETLALEPLDVEAVREITALYAPDHAAEDVPAEWVLGASAGVPRRVHDLASKWARREAARRVGTIAGRAAAGRAELRSMEAELAGGVARLQSARERAERRDEGEEEVVCPFKGLASFEAADAPYFFGREQLVADLVAQLVGAPLLGIVGPSGSGKSSVLQAGLLPALAGGVLPGSKDWPQALIRPGEHPLQKLRDAVDGLRAAPRSVLAVDQLEEVFTACRDQEERAAFISELVGASSGDAGVGVVIALRADYYGRCAGYPELSGLLAANHVLVGPMRPTELERAVVEPADRVGLQVEGDLVEALVGDVKSAPGALPLLSAALLELWRRRDGRRLRLASYERTGGVRKAVARLAEDAFDLLDETQQAVARRVLLRLAEVDDEGKVERRRLPLEELGSEDREDVAQVLGLLADSRLLTISEGTVEVAHEALLREWPRLRGWIEDDLEGLRVRRSLGSAAREWVRLGRDEGALYRGARLAEARDLSNRTDLRLTDLERDFLGASLDRERRERRTRRRRLAFAFGTLAVALVAIAAVAIVAIDERQEAERQRNIAQSRELALQSANVLEADPGLGLALAIRAVDTSPTPPAMAALREATLAHRALAVWRGDSETANTAALSPSARQAISGGSDGVVRVWDLMAQRETARVNPRRGGLLAARYSPDGQRIALGFEDGTVAVADPSLVRLRGVLRVPGQGVSSVAFNGDGTQIAAGFHDGTVRLVAGDDSEATSLLGAHRGEVTAVDISPDGERVVSAGKDGSVRLWDAANSTVRELHTGGRPQTAVSFSPDSKRVLAAGHDGFIRLWNTRGGAAVMRVEGEGRELLAAAFSSDGRRFAAGGSDGAIRVWSSSGGPPLAVLRGPSKVLDVGFGARSDRVISAGDDGRVRIWEAGRMQSWRAPAQAYAIDFNSDGQLIVGSGADDGTVRVWDASTGRLRASLAGRPRFTLARFSPRSDSIVIVGDPQQSVQVWRPGEAAARDVAKLRAGRAGNAASFDDTGQRIVYADDESRIYVHDLRSGAKTALRGFRDQIWDVRFSPDDRRVAAASEKGAVLVWRLDRPGQPERVLRGHDGYVATLAYSPNGERLASVGEDRTVRVWSSRAGRGAVLRGHDQDVTGVAFTRDGRRLITSSADGTVRLWDAPGGESLAVLDSGAGALYHLALSRDGRIATLGDQTVRVFKCEVCGTLAQVRATARSRAARSFTPEEKRRFLAAAP
jgi:WD40 repeat protein/DNA-binding SARP family transcriptional activator